ncbi:MAG: transglycosylase domain-containing protein, partial [Clostridia bacterium]|nr:transglycosylase domain-containing protein [Clostridia bacterium]
MSKQDDSWDIFSDSGKKDSDSADPWSAKSLLEDENQDIFSSSDHMVHSQLFEDERKKREPRANTKKKKRKKVRWVRWVATMFLSFCLVICLVVAAGAAYLFYGIDDTIDKDLNNLELAYTTLIYAKDGNGDWQEISSLHGSENRVWTEYDDFSPYLTDAVISLEDKRFPAHRGVDWKRTVSAFVNTFVDLYGGRQGGSSITQQLVKNLTGDNEISATRKVQEIMRSLRLEKEYTKATIIECYMNTVHFGNGCDGIETAARFYFNKGAKELSLLECAALAATIQTPNSINPIDGPEENKDRREACLKIMLEEEYISQEEYDSALKEELKVVDHGKDGKDGSSTAPINSYFVDALIENVIEDLMEEKNITYEEAEELIYSGGYRVYSSLDQRVQNALDSVYNDPSNFPSNYSGVRAQAAQTVMDYNGHIVGIAGGVGKKTENRSLNRAYQSTRQPGSSIKPLGVYAPAIEYNMLTYSSHIYDFHLRVGGGYYPRAAGSGAMVTTQRAVQSSLNSPAVRVCNELTPQKSYDFLRKRFNISTVVGSEKTADGTIISDKNLSALALGGMAHGVTVTEMTAAYATFGNLGQYYEPKTYYAVYNSFGDLVLSQEEEGTQVISPGTANVMNRILQTVVTGGTGTA